MNNETENSGRQGDELHWPDTLHPTGAAPTSARPSHDDLLVRVDALERENLHLLTSRDHWRSCALALRGAVIALSSILVIIFIWALIVFAPAPK